MSSDLIGYSQYSLDKKEMIFKKGPLFTNIFLADEINRTSSKTQSALLQVMEEGKITTDNITYDALKPFMVIATQNPFGSAGTQLLPDSQLDRFMMRLSLGYPDKNSEIEIINRKIKHNPIEAINPVINIEELLEIQQSVENVYISKEILTFIVEIVQGTRNHSLVLQGASPGGSIALMKASQALAYINNRDYVIDDDIINLIHPILDHRLILKANASENKETYSTIFKDILKNNITIKL